MLNRLLHTATLDGQAEALTKLHALVKERRPDGVLFAGRILGSNPVSHAAKLNDQPPRAAGSWERRAPAVPVRYCR